MKKENDDEQRAEIGINEKQTSNIAGNSKECEIRRLRKKAKTSD